MIRGALCAYVLIWLLTLAGAAIVDLGGDEMSSGVRRVLGLSLTARRDPPPHIAHVLALVAHNLPVAAWPLLLGATGAHRGPRSRVLADALLAVWLAANVLPVAAALGAYGARLLPYVPQLPLEWSALALGAGCWLAGRHRPLRVAAGLGWLTVIAAVLLCAASLEIAAVPHR